MEGFSEPSVFSHGFKTPQGREAGPKLFFQSFMGVHVPQYKLLENIGLYPIKLLQKYVFWKSDSTSMGWAQEGSLPTPPSEAPLTGAHQQLRGEKHRCVPLPSPQTGSAFLSWTTINCGCPIQPAGNAEGKECHD